MATKVHMEALSPTMEEGQVVKWHKSEGEPVITGELLAEVETDKATMELSARGEGVLRKILASEGATVPVGQVIAIIATEDEDISALVEDEGEDGTEPPARPAARKAEAAAVRARRREAREGESEEGEGGQAATEGVKGDTAPGRLKASPVARRLATEAGLDLEALEGSGPGGRIVKRDVEAAATASSEMGAAPTPALAWTGEREESFEDVKVSQMRKTIARRLIESLGPVPHFFLTIDVDMERTLEARARVNALLEEEGAKVSINDFVLKASAMALRRHPQVNSAWHGDHVRRFRHVHLGVAVAVDEGLITPVVRHADLKGLIQISREVAELAGRARGRKLKPEEYTGATFSVSNLGMFGVHEFTAVINPPEAGILAVGRTEEQAVVKDGQVVVRPRMRVTMSCDHRVVDGATGARFLQTLQAMLEEPAVMLA